MELFTERLKLKDIILELEKSEQKGVQKTYKQLKELSHEIAKEYDLKEDEIDFIRKNNPLDIKDIQIEDGERAAIRYINTADVDRDSEIVMPDGLQTRDFEKSKTVLYAHNYQGLPIGRDLWLKLIKGKGWLAKTLYASHLLANDVYNLVKDKFLNTSSIGFIPLESVKPDSKKWNKVKEKLISEWGIKEKLIDGVKRIYTKSLLLEHSDVPIPSNINALNIAVGKGLEIKSQELIDDLEIEIIDEEDEVELTKEGKKMLEESLKDVKEGRVSEVDLDDLDKEEETWLIKSSEVIKFEDVEKPFPNEHSCRIRSPGAFQSGSFRRMTRRSNGKVYSIIMGRLKGETTMTEQAYRYGIKVWTVSEARAHCKGHKGIAFEPASGKDESESLDTNVSSPDEKEKEEQNKSFSLDEIYEIVKINKELIKSLEEVTAELKAGAVLNRKNKSDLNNAQQLIQNVLDSAETAEPTEEGKELEIEEPAELEIKEDEKKEEESTEEKEETIDISADEIKAIVNEALDEQADKVGKKVKEIVNDNFKRLTGKVM